MWVATLEFERAGNCTLAYVVIMASSYTRRVYTHGPPSYMRTYAAVVTCLVLRGVTSDRHPRPDQSLNTSTQAWPCSAPVALN